MQNDSFLFYCPRAGQAFTFFLDEKSKQKNQEKIIPASTHKSRCTSGSRPFFRATALETLVTHCLYVLIIFGNRVTK